MPDDQEHEEEPRRGAPRPSGEGVRIIGAEEAAALDARQAGRLPDDSPRFGDRPPQPEGPRPSHRFPLPESGEPRSGPNPQLPHWTEPPTGEVPRILATDEDDTAEDLAAWSSFAKRPRWRDQDSDWAQPDFEDASELGGDEPRLGALDTDRSEESDLFSFDEPAAAAPAPPPVAPVGPRTTRISTTPPEVYEPAPTRRDERDVPVAVATGVGIAVLALALFQLGPAWALALAMVVVLLAAVEVFDVFRRAGYRPATLLGLVSIASLMLASYTRGERALPLVIMLTVVFTMLWYLGGVVKARPTINLGITLLGFAWVGVLGSFAALMLRYPNREGIAFLFAAVLATVANDVGALIAGRQFGRSPLAPAISPNKTWEGFAGGTLGAVLVSVAILPQVSPWDFGSALLLGIVVSVVAPLGDLCESMIKRDIGVKDMGSLLPGHGGVLDRFDAMLFVLPAVYYLVEFLDIAGG